MKKLLDILIPRFLMEWVVLEETENDLVPVYSLKDLEPGELPAWVVEMQVFNLFGIALFPKVVGEPIRYFEYLKRFDPV